MNRVVPQDGIVNFQKNIVTEVFISDDILLAQISSGNLAAWEMITDRHLSAVSRYATYILGDNVLSEDVAQETFIRLMKKAHTWEPGSSTLKAWLFKVARNLCIDYKRKKRSDPIETAHDLADPQDDNATDRRIDIANAVKTALDSLPERQKTAIVLVHYEGFSGAETAKLLGISVEAVESLLARARRNLRQTLGPHSMELLGES
ncbi:MAG: RNA polymerase sigma-70 factor [Rickettsiales bacterium]|nr:RNA polymerase sigma-70 factor [Rickettsiales bacterium]